MTSVRTRSGLRGPIGDSCSSYAILWVILAVIGFWPIAVWHGATGWIGVAAWWVAVILVIAVLGIVQQKKRNAGPHLQDVREAKRRNAEQERKKKKAATQYLKQFRAEGYNFDAAQAMARKRVREEDPEPHIWDESDIQKERLEAELQHRIDSGSIVRCPSCQQYASASQGVILAHSLDAGDVPCDGEGTVAGTPLRALFSLPHLSERKSPSRLGRGSSLALAGLCQAAVR
jgi:hypothetical protein